MTIETKKTLAFGLALGLISSASFADVADSASKRAFFTPSGQCRIVIPKGEFFISKEQVKSTGTTAYYALGNEKKLINYSFFIDTNTGSCTTNEKCLDAVLANKAYEKAKGLKRYERAGFTVAEFNLELPGKDGISIVQKNVLAES